MALGDKVPACLHAWKSCLRIEIEIMRGYFLLCRQVYVGISNKESQRVKQICNSSGEVEELEDTRPQEDSGDSSSSHQSAHEDFFRQSPVSLLPPQTRLGPQQTPAPYPPFGLWCAPH